MSNNRDGTWLSRDLSLSIDADGNQSVSNCKEDDSCIIDTGVILRTPEGIKVALNINRVDATAFVVLVCFLIWAIIVTGVIFRISEGTEVVLTFTKIGDVALAVPLGAVICIHDGSWYPLFLLRITFGWRQWLL